MRLPRWVSARMPLLRGLAADRRNATRAHRTLSRARCPGDEARRRPTLCTRPSTLPTRINLARPPTTRASRRRGDSHQAPLLTSRSTQPRPTSPVPPPPPPSLPVETQDLALCPAREGSLSLVERPTPCPRERKIRLPVERVRGRPSRPRLLPAQSTRERPTAAYRRTRPRPAHREASNPTRVADLASPLQAGPRSPQRGRPTSSVSRSPISMMLTNKPLMFELPIPVYRDVGSALSTRPASSTPAHDPKRRACEPPSASRLSLLVIVTDLPLLFSSLDSLPRTTSFSCPTLLALPRSSSQSLSFVSRPSPLHPTLASTPSSNGPRSPPPLRPPPTAPEGTPRLSVPPSASSSPQHPHLRTAGSETRRRALCQAALVKG